MTIDRRALLAAMPLSFFLVGALQARRRPAAEDDQLSWDGTWRGYWGGQESESTSITIVNNHVVSFEYRGESTPVSTSTVTPTTVSYEHNYVTIKITRTGPTSAMASLHSMMGDTTAQLTRQ